MTRKRNTTQLASTPTLYDNDAKKLLNSIQTKPTQKAIDNAKKLIRQYLGGE